VDPDPDPGSRRAKIEKIAAEIFYLFFDHNLQFTYTQPLKK
jgi:hypothetical protein